MNVHSVLHLHNISGNILTGHPSLTSVTSTPSWVATGPGNVREAAALAHLSVAAGDGDDDEDVVIPWVPDAHDGMPRLLPVPAAWWETAAVTTRALSARPEEARTARHFVRELLTCWGLEALSDDAEMIVDELVVNAVLHASRGVGIRPGQGAAAASVLRLCMLRRLGEVMLAVIDPGNEAPVPRQPDWSGESGRGLQIVGALSHVWGWSPIAGHGKAVWAVLRDS
jgi:anti-sigma regulatory factor (Ser/Thr protein kinase)